MGFFKEATTPDGSPSGTTARLHTIIWVSIYAGLVLLVLGIATRRSDETIGWVLIVIGTVAAVIGVVLIWVRSRMGSREQRP